VTIGALSLACLATTAALAQEHSEDAHAPAAEAAHGEAAHGEHGAHAHGPAPLNWTDFSDKSRPAMAALLINFALLAGLYYTLAKKPVVDGLKQRRVNIGKDIEDARKMLEEAKERAKKYQGDLKNADEDAATAKAALVTAGKGEAERLLVDADERSVRMKRDAGRLIEQERKQVERDLLVETIELAVAQAQKVLEKSATPEDHVRLASELLAELAKKPAAATRVGGAS
jgi:F-type H+-transporting ATPase subunit b